MGCSNLLFFCVFFLYNFLIAYFRGSHTFINFVLFMFLQLKKKNVERL